MPEEKLNLRQKLVKIRESIEYLQKSEKGNQGAYYVDVAVLLKRIRTEMNSHSVLLSPSIVSASMSLIPQPSAKSPNKNDHLCQMPMIMSWMDAESDEVINVPWFATGSHMTDPAMAMGGALTYTERYFLLKWFQIPTAKDDPEYFAKKTAPPAPVQTDHVWAADMKNKFTVLCAENELEAKDHHEIVRYYAWASKCQFMTAEGSVYLVNNFSDILRDYKAQINA